MRAALWIPSVERMSIEAPRRPCYLVEWYRPELTAAELDVTAARLEE
jgi:hypothetical protein